MPNKENNNKEELLELEKAEQQIKGWLHAYQGFDLTSLCDGMGLTKKEYKKMVKLGMLDYLSPELGKEILVYINKHGQRK